MITAKRNNRRCSQHRPVRLRYLHRRCRRAVESDEEERTFCGCVGLWWLGRSKIESECLVAFGQRASARYVQEKSLAEALRNFCIDAFIVLLTATPRAATYSTFSINNWEWLRRPALQNRFEGNQYKFLGQVLRLWTSRTQAPEKCALLRTQGLSHPCMQEAIL